MKMKKILCLFVSLVVILGLFSSFVMGGEVDSSNSNDITITPTANSSATAIAVSNSKFEVKVLKCNLSKGWTWDFNGVTAPLPQTMTQDSLSYKMNVKKFCMGTYTKTGSLVKGENVIKFKPYMRDRAVVEIVVFVTEIKGSNVVSANSAAINNVELVVDNNNDIDAKNDTKKDGKGRGHNENKDSNNVNASNENNIEITPTANSNAYAYADGDNNKVSANSAAINLIDLAVDNNNTIQTAPGQTGNGHNGHGHNNHNNNNSNNNTESSNENDITITPTATSNATAIANGDNNVVTANSYAINNIYNIVNNYNTTTIETPKKKDSISYSGSKTTINDGRYKKVKTQEEYIVPVKNTEIAPKGVNKEVATNSIVMNSKDQLPKTGETSPTIFIIIGIAVIGLGASLFGIRKYVLNNN